MIHILSKTPTLTSGLDIKNCLKCLRHRYNRCQTATSTKNCLQIQTNAGRCLMLLNNIYLIRGRYTTILLMISKYEHSELYTQHIIKLCHMDIVKLAHIGICSIKPSFRIIVVNKDCKLNVLLTSTELWCSPKFARRDAKQFLLLFRDIANKMMSPYYFIVWIPGWMLLSLSFYIWNILVSL